MTEISTNTETNLTNNTKRHYSATEKATLIKKWRSSGLSKVAFCRCEGIGESVFYGWTRPGKMKQQAKPSPIGLNPAKVITNQDAQMVSNMPTTFAHPASVRVELANGIRLSIPLPTNADAMINLIKGLACN